MIFDVIGQETGGFNKMGLFTVISQVKAMKGRGSSALMRIWMPEINDRQVSKMLGFVMGKGMNAVDVHLVKHPTVEEMAESGAALPEPKPIKPENLIKTDDALESDKPNVILFRDYDKTNDEIKELVFNAINNHGFTPGTWDERTMVFMIDEGRNKSTIIDVPMDSLES